MDKKWEWLLRIVFIAIAIVIFITGVLFSFLGAYDVPMYSSNKKQVFHAEGTELAAKLEINVNSGVEGYNGIIGIDTRIEDSTVEPKYLDNNGTAISFKEQALNSKIRWGSIKMSSTQTLNLELLIPSSGSIQISYYVTVYTASKSVQAVSRTIGTLVFIAFVCVVIGFEYALWRDKQKYGNEADTHGTRFKAQFEMK